MYVQHSSAIWRDYPELVAGVLWGDGITANATVDDTVTRYSEIASARLASGTESDLPEIRAWRQTFSRMGLKPTQYRCAAESLLRRFRNEGTLPAIHPLIDVCNAVSRAFAIPIAVFDASRISGGIEVRHADGSERYQTFSGDTEHPEVGEVIFADEAGEAHARRWTHRQSGLSAIREATSSVLIVAEAMHATAAEDIPRLMATLAGELQAIWSITPQTAQPSASAPRVER